MEDIIYSYCNYNSAVNTDLDNIHNVFRTMISISNNKLNIINNLILMYVENADTNYSLIMLSNLDDTVNNYVIINSINEAVGFPVVIRLFRYTDKKFGILLIKKIYNNLLVSLNNRIIMCKILENNNVLEYVYNEPIYIKIYTHNKKMLNYMITNYIHNYVSRMTIKR